MVETIAAPLVVVRESVASRLYVPVALKLQFPNENTPSFSVPAQLLERVPVPVPPDAIESVTDEKSL